jgi:tRNA wybutosine-synthesizing protein 1
MSQTIKHVALSLTGEPIIYPRINDLIKLFHKQGISTFLVTNAQYPEQIKDLTRVTQLYLSVDAPNQILLKEIDKPLFGDYWERLNKSLEYCSQKKDRTCIRLTLIKDVNDVEPENYAKLILKGNADFIEVKAYMHVGGSRKRLKVEDMPWHEDVAEFSKRLLEYLPEYDIVSEHIPSRVVMIAKKRFKKKWKWFTWIDFDKWQKLIESEKDFNTEDFLKETPETGLSGRIIRQEVEEKIRKKIERQKSNDEMSADENTSELDLE